MVNNYKIIHLVNGTTLVGDVIHTPDEIIIRYPLEVVTRPIKDPHNQTKLIGEAINLRPFIWMSDDIDIAIDTFNVLTEISLAPSHYENYEAMVMSSYKTSIRYSGVNEYDLNEPSDEELQEIENLSEQERTELQNFLNRVLTNNDIKH